MLNATEPMTNGTDKLEFNFGLELGVSLIILALTIFPLSLIFHGPFWLLMELLF